MISFKENLSKKQNELENFDICTFCQPKANDLFQEQYYVLVNNECFGIQWFTFLDQLAASSNINFGPIFFSSVRWKDNAL